MSGGGSSRNQNVTQTSEPPEYLRPYLTQAAQASSNLYNQGPMEYFPGETVVPFSGATQEALTNTASRARHGSLVNQEASRFASGTLGRTPNSQYGSARNPYASAENTFGGASNPYLDATFNRAADSVQNRLASQFAGAGRNIDASRNVNASELNDLATNIYGGAYENERNRQLQYQSQLTGIGAQGYELERDRMANDINQQRQQQLGVLGLAPQIANQDYVDLDRLRGVGAEYEDLTGRQMEDAAARWDYAQNAPGLSLDQYITRLQGQPGSQVTTSTPIYRNQAAGALGGALAGSQLGSQFNTNGNSWGSLIGLIGGGLLGGYG